MLLSSIAAIARLFFVSFLRSEQINSRHRIIHINPLAAECCRMPRKLWHAAGMVPPYGISQAHYAKYAIFSVSILCKMWNSRSGAHRFNKSRVFSVVFFPRSLKRYATICRYAPCRSMIQQVDLRSGRIKRYCKGCYQQRSCWLASGYGKAIRHFMVRHK